MSQRLRWDNKEEWFQEAWWRLWHRPWFPYPLRAAKISIDIHPFGFWWTPSWHHRKNLKETARQEGETIWWARWMWFQVSYARWM